MYSLDEENRGGKRRPATAPHRPRSAVAALLATDAGRAVGNGRAAPDPRPKQLFDAALLGELSVATRLLKAGVGPNAFRDQFGSTPLLVAARGGHRRLCTALIEAGALPTVARGVAAAAPIVTKAVASAAPPLTKGAIAATCYVSQANEIKPLEERVAELERQLRACDERRAAEQARAQARLDALQLQLGRLDAIAAARRPP